jgi:hypothetical protein
LLERVQEVLGGFYAANPSNSGWLRALSASHNKVGEVLQAQGDLAAAFSAYRQSLAVHEQLVAVDSSNAFWQRDLWVSYSRMANISEQLGIKEAVGYWHRAYAVLSAMKARGLFISPGDLKFLDILRRKCGGL